MRTYTPSFYKQRLISLAPVLPAWKWFLLEVDYFLCQTTFKKKEKMTTLSFLKNSKPCQVVVRSSSVKITYLKKNNKLVTGEQQDVLSSAISVSAFSVLFPS